MGGPIATFTPGWRRRTASASRCALECRSTASASGSSLSLVVRIWMRSPSSSARRRSLTAPFERRSTASSASFGPIAAAASRPVAPSGSSSSDESGSTTFMVEQDTSHPRDDDRNDELEERPAPDPEEREPRPEDEPRSRLDVAFDGGLQLRGALQPVAL